MDYIENINGIKVCRDPNDDFLLALAKDGKANYLLTGDKDLLEIKAFEKIKIVTLAEFLNKYNKKGLS